MSDAQVFVVEHGRHQVTRSVVVNAPAADIFAIVADPHRHPELDGSGTVRDVPVSGPDRLSQGARFTVGMKQYGVPYKITSTVTGFDDGRLVEWQHPMGHRWRWELAELTPDRTQVTETFDYSTSRVPKMVELFRMDGANAVGITSTLEGLAARYA